MDSEFRFRALVVDDEAVLRQLLIRALSNVGIRCDMADDGQTALDWAAGNNYDLIVSDLRMPGMNGHTLCVSLLDMYEDARAAGDGPMITVLTGVCDPRIIKDLELRGVDKVHLKPVDCQHWAEELRRSLDARALSAGGLELPAREGSSKSHGASHCVVVLSSECAFSHSLAKQADNFAVDVVVAVSTDHLLEVVESKRVDLLILDQNLPGFLKGDQIVSRLHSELINIPAFLRVQRTEDEFSEKETEKFDGVERLIADDVAAEDVLQTAERFLGQLSRRRLMLDSTARKLVTEFSEVPPIPHVLTRLAHFLAEPASELSIPKLTSEIQKDPRLTSELIKVANSAQVASTSRQNDLKSVITLLGPRQAILMCLSIGMRTVRSQLMKPWADDFRDWYLKRSAMVAATAEACAKHLDDVPSETAFLLGVLSDIGILVLAEHHGQKYFDRVIQRFRSIPTLQLVKSERIVTNTDHSMVTAAVLESWKFPFSIVQPIYAQHLDIDDSLPKMGAGLVRCLRVGEAFAEMCDQPAAQRVNAFNSLLSRYYDVSRHESRHVFLEAIEKANQTAEILRTPPLEMSELQQIINQEGEPLAVSAIDQEA